MKKIFKYSLMLLAAGFVLASCSDEYEYTPASVPTGAQVYFGNEMANVIDLSKSESSFTVTVLRATNEGEVSVPVTATMPEGSIYKVPATVTFAAGQNSSDIVITYDPEELNYGEYTDITLQIGDSTYTTPYGISTYSFSAGATEWVSMGLATFRANFFGAFGAEAITYQVEIQKSIVVEGIYRLVNPFGAAYPFNDPGDWDDTKDYYMVINATDPDYVWVPLFCSGVDWGYGPTNFASEVQYYLDKGYDLATIKSSSPESFGQMVDGVISFPNAGNFTMGFGDAYASYSDNREGLNAIALPGYRIADYGIAYEYLGRFIDLDKQYYVEGIAALGEDVASAKAALVTEETYEGVYDALAAGTYEDAVTVVNGETFRLPFNESNSYYVLIVAFNAEGEVAGELTYKVKAEIEGGVATINWEAKAVGDYYFAAFSKPKENDYFIQEDLTLSVDADNASHYQIAPWGKDKTLEFFMNEDGTITVPEDQSVGYAGQKGEYFVADVQTYTEGDAEYADYVSSYNAEKKVFTFCLVYYNEGGETGIAVDTFTLKEESGVKAQHVSSKRINPGSFKCMKRIPSKALKYVPAM